MAETTDPRADYDVFDDPYCYKGTNVLKNIPGLRDPAALAAFTWSCTLVDSRCLHYHRKQWLRLSVAGFVIPFSFWPW